MKKTTILLVGVFYLALIIGFSYAIELNNKLAIAIVVLITTIVTALLYNNNYKKVL